MSMDKAAKKKQGKRNRRFGHDAERELARELREKTGHRAARITMESQLGNLGDVFLDAGEDTFKWQVRSGLKPSIWRAVADIDAACAGTPHTPLVLLNKSNGPGMPRDRLVVIRLEYFLPLFKLAYPDSGAGSE